MPNRAPHVAAGVVGGMAAGVATCASVPDAQRTLYVAVAAGFGMIGGALPDVLEPATSPNHRSVCHSLILLALLAVSVNAKYHERCLERAASCDSRARRFTSVAIERLAEERAAIGWRLLAAALIGATAGYASHLILDSSTAKGLPLVASGF
jgi:membrane-bound metal-dependent hydrolase YbcI (DUF457 family)